MDKEELKNQIDRKAKTVKDTLLEDAEGYLVLALAPGAANVLTLIFAMQSVSLKMLCDIDERLKVIEGEKRRGGDS